MATCRTSSTARKAQEWLKYPFIRQKLEHEIKDDGIFWMSYDDFIDSFGVLWWNESGGE